MLFHSFDSPPRGDHGLRRRLLGGKGAGLASMTAAGLPVPPGFTLTTDACQRYRSSGWDETLDAAVRDGIAQLEERTGKRLGDRSTPLLVSVRSGSEVSMPGMMDTVLDVGMNATVEAALAEATGDASFAADTRCRALRSFADIVLSAPADAIRSLEHVTAPDDLAAELAELGLTVPDDGVEQVVAAVRSVFESWFSPRARHYREVEGIDHSLGTSATVQAMVFGNLDHRSGTGVAFTRDPATGAPGLMGDFLPRAQGEDVVAGASTTLRLGEMATAWPDQFADLERIAEVLEHAMADMVDIEFTIEAGVLWMLQVRRGKRSPLATLRCAIDMAEDEAFPVDRAEAVARCRSLLDDPPSVAVGDRPGEAHTVIATGLPASPGVATGVLCTDPDEAVELEADGQSVILVRRETSPADVHGMAAAAGLFTLLGGLVSHAAVVARDWGLPAVVGATEAHLTGEGLVGPGGLAPLGATVTVDGSAGTIALGAERPARREASEVETIRQWARSLSDRETSVASDPAADDDVTFPVLRALRIKGMADEASIATTSGTDPSEVAAVLARLTREGVVHVEKRGLWRLTDEGLAAHALRLAEAVTGIDLDSLPYDEFLVLNDSFKQLCTDWQMRDGVPNDHDDDAYDAGVVAELAVLDRHVQRLLSQISAVLPWLTHYGPRLAASLVRVSNGDPKAFTGVLCESYHDVWMELHEDLILTQGIDRAAEGST